MVSRGSSNYFAKGIKYSFELAIEKHLVYSKKLFMLSLYQLLILNSNPRLFFQNKALRENNKRLQKHTDSISTENSELRIRLGLTPPVSPESSPCPVSLPPSPEPHNTDDYQNGWVVIKKEAESKEFAALTASQQQKNLILFLLVITTWLRINTR